MMMMKTLHMLWTVVLFSVIATDRCSARTAKGAAKNGVLQANYVTMSLFAQQTLLDEVGVDKLLKIKGEPVPLYREDLPDDYVAYWEVEYGTEYMIVSSGQQTGDYDTLLSGKLPTQTSRVRDDARRRGATCFRFYVLTSTAAMMCTDKDGIVVGTNLPEYVFSSNGTLQTSSAVDDYIRSRSADQAEIWQAHAERVREQQLGHGDDEGDDEDDDVVRPDASSDEGTLQAQEIKPGHAVQVVIGDRDAVLEVRIRYVMTGPEAQSRVASLNDHTKLCQVTKGCEAANENYAEMSPDLTEDHPAYFDLELDVDAKKIFKGEEFVFAVDIVLEGDEEDITTRYFAVEYQQRRKKRSSQYEPWSSWTTWSIPHENDFPDYNQFLDGGCQVGCGPVAWAMVFGYYDRRDHNSASYSGSTNLYRSGNAGISGSSSAIAPLSNTARMDNYIKNLNNVMGTFCLVGSGATLAGKMPTVESFFKARQTTGSPDVIEKRHWLTWAAIYSDNVEDWAEARLKEGIPVILGWRDGSYFAWHYPVATMVKTRTRKYKRCRWFVCRWRTETERKVYMHMGWGGYRNDWYNLQAYYAVTAKY